MDVLEVRGRFGDCAALEEEEEILVLDDRVLLPGLHHRFAARASRRGACVKQVHLETSAAAIVAAAEVDVVEREVGLVVAIRSRGPATASAIAASSARMRAKSAGPSDGPTLVSAAVLEGAMDLVEVPDVVERERVERKRGAEGP